MNRDTAHLIALCGSAFLCSASLAQQAYIATPVTVMPPMNGTLSDVGLEWTTLDNSSRPLHGPGGVLLEGSAGQFDPGLLVGGTIEMFGGFWVGVADELTTAPQCYANCDGSSAAPILNVADFTCFLQKFSAQDPYANCDGSTAEPTLNIADFTCFLQSFSAGCP